MYNYDRRRKADLSPPLGRPGGPCHIVQRIDKEVHSPGLKEVLVDKVEEGRDLSNPEAAKVYKLDAEKVRGLVTTLLIGPHAQYRMDLRGITVKDLREVIMELGKTYHEAKKSGDTRQLRYYEAFNAGQKLEYTSSKGLTLVLVATPAGAQVVTTYWKGVPDPKPSGQCKF